MRFVKDVLLPGPFQTSNPKLLFICEGVLQNHKVKNPAFVPHHQTKSHLHLIGPHPSGCMSNQTWALQQADFFVVVTLMLLFCFSGIREFDDMKNAHRLIVFTCLHCHSRHGSDWSVSVVGLGLRPCKVEAQRFLNMTIRHLA